MAAEDRFWKLVAEQADGCWLWTGYCGKGGYGHFNAAASRPTHSVMAHRFAYEAVVGVIPAGLTLHHACSNPPCVNPAHLEPMTLLENVRRGRRATATHCRHGHPFNRANTYRDPNTGARNCRVCNRAAVRRYRDRRGVVS